MKFTRANKPKQFLCIWRLYNRSFPLQEKKPFFMMLSAQRRGQCDIWHIEDGGKFTGLAITMKSRGLVLLDYFAIEENCRSRGYGSRALKMLESHYKDSRFFLEVERLDENSDNLEQRRRRMDFYLRNGMNRLGMSANVFGTDFEILTDSCTLDFEEYKAVYHDIYGEHMARNVKRSDG